MDELLLSKIKKALHNELSLDNLKTRSRLFGEWSSKISDANHLAEIQGLNNFLSHENNIERINVLDSLSTTLVMRKEINVITYNEDSKFFYFIILRNITMPFAWPQKYGFYDDFEDLLVEAIDLIDSLEEKSKSELIQEVSKFKSKMFKKINELRAKHGISVDMGE